LSCALGREPLVVGKPEAPMLESIVQTYVRLPLRVLSSLLISSVTSHGLDKSKMIMVGDRLNTDIAFGNNGGVDTLMVLTGSSSSSSPCSPSAAHSPSTRHRYRLASRLREGGRGCGADVRGRLAGRPCCPRQKIENRAVRTVSSASSLLRAEQSGKRFSSGL
jgi:hypothetical protein